MEASIPIQALTINQAFQGRRFKTKLCKDFEQKCFILLPKREMVMGWVQVHYVFGLTAAYFSRTDVGNLEKILSDVIVKVRYIEDDRKVLYMTLRKILTEQNYINIRVEKVESDTL